MQERGSIAAPARLDVLPNVGEERSLLAIAEELVFRSLLFRESRRTQSSVVAGIGVLRVRAQRICAFCRGLLQQARHLAEVNQRSTITTADVLHGFQLFDFAAYKAFSTARTASGLASVPGSVAASAPASVPGSVPASVLPNCAALAAAVDCLYEGGGERSGETPVDVPASYWDAAFAVLSAKAPSDRSVIMPKLSYKCFDDEMVVMNVTDESARTDLELAVKAESRSQVPGVSAYSNYLFNLRVQGAQVPENAGGFKNFGEFTVNGRVSAQQSSLWHLVKLDNLSLKNDCDPNYFIVKGLPVKKPVSVPPWLPLRALDVLATFGEKGAPVAEPADAEADEFAKFRLQLELSNLDASKRVVEPSIK